MANKWENVETVTDFIFLGSKITAEGDCNHKINRHLLLGRKVMTNLDSTFKSRDITLLTKIRLVKAMVFPVVMYGWESWAEIQPVHPKGNQPWDFFGRNDAKAETPVFWPPHAKS